MSSETLMMLIVALPLLTAVAAVVCGRSPNLRESVSVVGGLCTFGVVMVLADRVFGGERPQMVHAEWLGGTELTLAAEPLGVLFALVASGLWIPTTVYAAGYMRGHHEKNQTRFFACFALAIAAAMAAALAGDVLMLFFAYEAMTLSTYPLVTHHGNREARDGGRVYLGILIGTSIAFFLFAVAWTASLAGTLRFADGGIVATAYESGTLSRTGLFVLVALYGFGIAKAAVMPFHRWLPAAMVAPTPVSALLHAVAVVKVGVFAVVKIMLYVFGIELLTETSASLPLAYVAGFSILVASLVAMRQDNLKRRLAYSTVSQLGYITLGAFIANANGIVGSGMHIAMHAVGKITLFFCAGAIFVAHHEKNISDMRGLGYKMPWTFAAFGIATISIIGLPPGGGSWSKWFLALGTADANQFVLTAVLMISSLLNIAYLLPIPLMAFAIDSKRDDEAGIRSAVRPAGQEAPALCVVPLVATALLSVGLFFLADPIRRALQPIVQPPSFHLQSHHSQSHHSASPHFPSHDPREGGTSPVASRDPFSHLHGAEVTR